MKPTQLFSLLLAINAVKGQEIEDGTGCFCQAVCHAIGDPHIEDFNGETKKIFKGVSTMYEEGDWSLVITTGDYDEIKNISFGDELFTVTDDCTENNQLIQRNYTFENGDSIQMDANCEYYASHTESPWRFDIHIYKYDVSTVENTFNDMERSIGSTGLCVNLNNPSGSGTYQPTCHCQTQALCKAVGDPHVEDFFGDIKKITETDMIFYTQDGFQISGITGDYDEMVQFTFGDVTYNVNDDCPTSTTTYTLQHSWSNGDMIQAELYCKYLEDHTAQPYRFDVFITKTDITENASESMRTAEDDLESTGLCVNMVNSPTVRPTSAPTN